MTKYDIAANVTIAGLDGFYGKLSAAQQREVFGAVVFGRKTVDIDATGQGTVRASWRATGPVADTLFADVSFERIAAVGRGEGGVCFG